MNEFLKLFAIVSVFYIIGFCVGYFPKKQYVQKQGIQMHQQVCVDSGVGKWVPVSATSNNFEFIKGQ